jgi:hypothetical protein
MKIKIDINSLFEEQEDIVEKENKTYEKITEGLNNYLNDEEGLFRIPCFVRNGILFCYLAGGSHFIYDRAIRKITKLNIIDSAPINIDIKSLRLCIDIAILDRIFLKITTPREKSFKESIKEKYRISKKRIGSKDLEIIAKYEKSLKK